MIFLSADEVLHIAARVLGSEPAVRDIGLIESAVARPKATVFGEDAYPTVHHQAAALLHSLVQNHALVDGNKRLGLAGVIVFYAINGWRFEATNDQAYDLVLRIATGELAEVGAIAEALRLLVSDIDDG